MARSLLTIAIICTSLLSACSESKEKESSESDEAPLTFCECMKKDREMRKKVKSLSDPEEQAKVKDEYSDVLSQCEDLADRMTEMEIDEALKNCDIE